MNARTLPDQPIARHALAALWLGLVCLGCVAVGSASMDLSMAQSGEPLALLQRHLLYVALGALALLTMLSIPVSVHAGLWPLYAVGVVLLLVAVLLPQLGTTVNGSRRWIALPGFTLQPSEFARPAALIAVAGLATVGRGDAPLGNGRTLLLFLFVGFVAALLVLEPDFGGAVILFSAASLTIFLAGARLRYFLLMIVAALTAAALLVLGADYRQQRILAFLDPWRTASNEGYQLIQALVAIGRGEWVGVGIGAGLQKLFYLPEAHTDFIVAVLVEETGVLGFLCLLTALLALAGCAFSIGRAAEESRQQFAALLAYGVGALLAVQTLVSLGVNIGFLPTKGLTTPFISFGGNSLIALSALVGLVLRIDFETQLRRQKPGRRRSR